MATPQFNRSEHFFVPRIRETANPRPWASQGPHLRLYWKTDTVPCYCFIFGYRSRLSIILWRQRVCQWLFFLDRIFLWTGRSDCITCCTDILLLSGHLVGTSCFVHNHVHTLSCDQDRSPQVFHILCVIIGLSLLGLRVLNLISANYLFTTSGHISVMT